MKKIETGWTPTVEQRIQLEEGLSMLDEAQALLQEASRRKNLSYWTQKWIQDEMKCIDGIRASLHFILSGHPSIEAWMFYSWIDHPAFCLKEVQLHIEQYMEAGE